MTATTESIWKEFSEKLHGFIYKRVKDENATNDILQDIFVKIHLKLGTLSNTDKLTSWVYTIARNSILDHFRTTKKFTDLSESLAEPEQEQYYNEELATCLQPVIKRLPAQAQEAILQTDLGKYSQKEFAAAHGLSYTGAKSRIQRARQQLHELFNECCRVEADRYGNVTDHDCKTDCGCK